MRPTTALLLASITLASCGAGDPAPKLSSEAEAVVARSKTTQATYAAYAWTKVERDGRMVEEWSAEFHDGAKHRVETPSHRLIADCVARVGKALTVATGEIYDDPKVAVAACGVNTNPKTRASAYLGSIQTPFGKADRITVTDAEVIRSYDITSQGVIVGGTYRVNDENKRLVLEARAVAVESMLPAADMFDAQSLQKSFVPERYKAPPANP